MSENIVIVASARTAVGPIGGSLGPLDKVRGSRLKPVHLAIQVAACEDAQIIFDSGRGGWRSAHFQSRSRDGQRMGKWPLLDTTIVGVFRDAFNRNHRGVTDETFAKYDGFSRQELDIDSAASQEKTEAAVMFDRFVDEIVQISIPQRKSDAVVIAKGESPLPGITTAVLGQLKPTFDQDGTITSGINDDANSTRRRSAMPSTGSPLPVSAMLRAWPW